MRVDVRNNNVDQALRVLKKRLLLEGFFNELRERECFVSKGDKRRRGKSAGIRRFKKEQKKRMEELGY